MSNSIVKCSVHQLIYSNTNKRNNINEFIDEYRRVASIVVNEIWDNGLSKVIKGEIYNFNPKKNEFDIPSFIPISKWFNIETFLTARALESLGEQVAAALRAATKKQQNRVYMLKKQKDEGVSKSKLKQLIKKMKHNIPQKPNMSNLNPNIATKHIQFMEWEGHFDMFVRLMSYSKQHKNIWIPIKLHNHAKELKSKGTLANGVILTKQTLQLNWKMTLPDLKEEGIVVGADQGLKDVMTLSDGNKAGYMDKHGHTLDSILDKMTRKKKGSKAFKRMQSHRTNFINWSIKQINFADIKEFRLEEIWNIGFRNKTNRKLSHWTNTTIRDKVEDLCATNGVHLVRQSSTYRSQRCSCCGNVRKANRKGKIYSCGNCGLVMDADLNAAKNHEIDLPEIPDAFRKRNLNRKDGFFWNPDGLFDFSGRSLESLPHVEDV